MKILIWIILFYLVYRLLSNIFKPVKLSSNRNAEFEGTARPKEGKISIKDVRPDQDGSGKSRKSHDEEYIDYKEL